MHREQTPGKPGTASSPLQGLQASGLQTQDIK